MNIFTNWKEKLTDILEVRLNLIKLGLIERISSVLGFIMFSFIILLLGIAVLIFLGIGVEELFAHITGSRIAGAFLAMAFYVALAAILIVGRKGIMKLFAGLFIGILTDQGDEEQEPKGDKIKVD